MYFFFFTVTWISPPCKKWCSSLILLLSPLHSSERSHIVQLFLWYEKHHWWLYLFISSTDPLLTTSYVFVVVLMTTLLIAGLLVLTKGGWMVHGCCATPEKDLQLPTRDTSANGNDKLSSNPFHSVGSGSSMAYWDWTPKSNSYIIESYFIFWSVECNTWFIWKYGSTVISRNYNYSS